MTKSKKSIPSFTAKALKDAAERTKAAKSKKQANPPPPPISFYEVLQALEDAIESAAPEKKIALAATMAYYADDFPDEFFWAIGPRAPGMLSDLMLVASGGLCDECRLAPP